MYSKSTGSNVPTSVTDMKLACRPQKLCHQNSLVSTSISIRNNASIITQPQPIVPKTPCCWCHHAVTNKCGNIPSATAVAEAVATATATAEIASTTVRGLAVAARKLFTDGILPRRLALAEHHLLRQLKSLPSTSVVSMPFSMSPSF